MLVGPAFWIVGGGGGGGGGVNTCIPKQTYIPVICQDARARVCVCVFVCVCRVSGTPFPSSWSVYIGHMWFVCATMSHARDVVYKSEILGVAIHSCALPEGEGCGPIGNHNTIGFLSNTGLEPTKTRKATKSAFNVGPQSTGQRNAKRISMAKPL